MGYILVPAVVVLAVVGWFFYQYSEVQRDLALERLARRAGMHFRFGLPQELKDVLHRFRVIEDAQAKGGDFTAGINSIVGARRDRKLVFFDFQWKTVVYVSTWRRSIWRGGGYDNLPHTRTQRRSAVAAQLGVSVQPLLIRPERIVDKALALVGYEDIDFTSMPEFSDRFYVNSPDRESARRLVTPAVSRFFLENVTCTVDFVGPWLLLHDDAPMRSSAVEKRLELASRLAELVTRELAAGPRPP
jgi:hypothetical protein